MTAAATGPLSNRSGLGLIALGVAAATFVGVALMQRGPDTAFLPEMAAQPVVMEDGRLLYAQRFEVTVAEWNRCAADDACSLTLRARPDQDPTTTPATGLSYMDVDQYVLWINKKSRHDFRLLSRSGSWDRRSGRRHGTARGSGGA